MHSKTAGRALLALALLAALALAVWLVRTRNWGLALEGNLYERRAQFSAADAPEAGGLSEAFLRSVTFRVTRLDKKAKTALVTLEVPDLAGLDALVREGAPDAGDYRERLAAAEQSVRSALEGGALPRRTASLEMPVQKRARGGWYLEPTDEWRAAVFGQLEELADAWGAKAMGGGK